MIVTSLIDEKKYFWVKVPRTATTSYKKLFFPELSHKNTRTIHLHIPFSDTKTTMCQNFPQLEAGFSLVRNPVSRFISGLKYLKRRLTEQNDILNIDTFLSICEFCGEITILDRNEATNSFIESRKFINFLENETVFYDLIYSHFDKNCNLKSGYMWGEVFQTENPSLVKSMFVTQTEFVYNPKVKIFHYENIHQFNSWIEHTLGYSASAVSNINSSKDVELNIDFTTKKFKDMVKYLFHDDFKLFGYDI